MSAIGRHLKTDDPELETFLRLLIPGKKRRYQMAAKRLIKVFSIASNVAQDILTKAYETGDHAGNLSDTLAAFWVTKVNRSTYTVTEIDAYLDRFSKASKIDDQVALLSDFGVRATQADMLFFIRLLLNDVRMGAQAKTVLQTFGAYEAWQAESDLKVIADKIRRNDLLPSVTLFTPVAPMLASPAKVYSKPFVKLIKLWAEIKLDGERLQLHWTKDKQCFFSRSSKPKALDKIEGILDHLATAFQGIESVVLDGEILLIDSRTSEFLPFVTMGKHKKAGFSHAKQCFVIFDILYLNGESLLHLPLVERRKIIEDRIKPVKHRILFSQIHEVSNPDQLRTVMERCIDDGLEGLVMKALNGPYSPGKRHWMKMKKDYLDNGAMADSADLLVLGGYYGTGKKGGMINIWLLGVHDG
jgi:DNA ligase-3